MRRRNAIVARARQARLDHKPAKGKSKPPPMNELGYIDLPKSSFDLMTKNVKTAEDLDVMKDAYV